jgi:hypothetical protein
MPIPLLALALSTHLIAVAGDRVPAFDMGPTCKSTARTELGGKADVDTCLSSENGARDELAKRWSQFPASDRARCSTLVHTGGPPSYIELLTCLEMSADVQRLRRDQTKAHRVDPGTGNVGVYHSPKR